jgi:methylmalonyl-CoA mutase cobalamin-binding subunit
LDEPYIIQDRIAQTRSRHVVVIWDAWDEMDRADRGRVIADAFQDAGVKDVIRVGMGVTQQEALNMGYLRYQVVANLKKTDGPEIYQAVKRAHQDSPRGESLLQGRKRAFTHLRTKLTKAAE